MDSRKNITFDHIYLCFMWHAVPSVARLWTTVPSLLILCKKTHSRLRAKSTLIAPSCLVLPCLHESPMMLCLSFDLCTTQNTTGTGNTHFKVRKIALLVFVSALSWKKRKSLIWLLVSIIFCCACYKILSIRKKVEKLLKVQSCFEHQTHTDRVIIIVQANQHLSNISVIQPQMSKTTVDEVVEGLESECAAEEIWVLQQRCQIKSSCEHQPLINPSAIKHSLFSGWHFLSVSF